jgi:hypothetical protein
MMFRILRGLTAAELGLWARSPRAAVRAAGETHPMTTERGTLPTTTMTEQHTPSEYGLDYEDITFAASDGITLEAWFIPAPRSTKIVIANHPMGFSRCGLPAHLQPWQADCALSGNGFEVNFLPDYKILHDAGYHVLAYDMRNHGMSSAANGGVTTGGVTESRDVVGSLDYVRWRTDTREMAVALFSRCMGGSLTFSAMTRYPEAYCRARGSFLRCES